MYYIIFHKHHVVTLFWPMSHLESDGKGALVWMGEGVTQLTFTCSKLTIETLEKGVKHVQS